jgi:hypothetical protein
MSLMSVVPAGTVVVCVSTSTLVLAGTSTATGPTVSSTVDPERIESDTFTVIVRAAGLSRTRW